MLREMTFADFNVKPVNVRPDFSTMVVRFDELSPRPCDTIRMLFINRFLPPVVNVRARRVVASRGVRWKPLITCGRWYEACEKLIQGLSRYARPSGIFTAMDVPTYRVELDVYSGPLELLLFLIRKNEVDIYDIPIARITSQYLAHVEVIRQIDINLAGDFLVMAATLMEIKSRMLNPQPTADTAGGGVAETVIDPRQALVEQLLQYKRYKDAANHLQRRAHTEQLRFTRAVQKSTGRAPLDIEDLNLFQLIDAFTAIMASVGHSAYGHDVVYDDTPISLHQADILDRVHRDGSITLQELFIGRKSKSEMIGLFLAMLELIRLKKLTFEQTEAAGRILLRPGEAAKPESAGGSDAAAAGQDEATAVDDPAADAISHRDVAAPTSEVDTHAEFRPTA